MVWQKFLHNLLHDYMIRNLLLRDTVTTLQLNNEILKRYKTLVVNKYLLQYDLLLQSE